MWSLCCITFPHPIVPSAVVWSVRDCRPMCNITLCFFFLLLNRQRKNSTGNASHHILLWWMCWLRPCMSCLQPQTVSLCIQQHVENNVRGSEMTVILHWINRNVKISYCHFDSCVLVPVLCWKILFMSWEKPASSTSSLVASASLGLLDSSQCKHSNSVLQNNVG